MMESRPGGATTTLTGARQAIDAARTRDRGRLLGLWSRWKAAPAASDAREAFSDALQASIQAREAAAARLPSAAVAAELPIAVVNGAHEPIVRLGYLSSLDYRWLWDDRCYVIAGAGHAPFWTAPEAFNELLGRFLHDVEVHLATDRRRVAHGG